VGDEPSNAASRYLSNVCAVFTEFGLPSEDEVRAGLADDFAYEDRRRVFRFPDADVGSYPVFVGSVWQTGAGGQPRFEVETLAVRGERFAVIGIEIDYGNGMLAESVHVFGLDATLSLLQRDVDFDLDDLDGAIAELDRLHSEANA